MCCTTNSKIRKLHGPASIWDHQQNHKVMTNSMLYIICREILFQKVALGYVLHFVQNESSENILKHTWLHNNLKQNKSSHNQFYVNDTRTSSSRKLRWVIDYTLYRMDPHKTYKNKHVCITISKIRRLHGPASNWEHPKNIKL